MKVTIRSNDRTLAVDVDSDELVENLKAILEVEAQIPLVQQQLWFGGKELLNSMKLNTLGIRQNSMLTLVATTILSAERSIEGGHWSIQEDGSASNVVELHKQLQKDPIAMAQLQQRNPDLAQSVLKNDTQTFQRLLRAQHQQKLMLEEKNRDGNQGRPSKRQHQEVHDPTSYSQSNDHHHMFESNSILQAVNNQPSTFPNHDLLFSDPFDVDVQKRIEEAIRQKNVDDNWEAAIEHNPEAFARVIMLYVDMEVNGYPLKAFVDSGAQSTIISMHFAESCGLLRLLDRRYVGIAKGVGQSTIVGRIHVAPLKIGRNYYPCSFTVLEHADIEFIFGLDMLRKHQCTIDLKENVLWIGGGELAVPFLQEKDLPRHLLAKPQTKDTLLLKDGITNSYGMKIHPPALVHAPLSQGPEHKVIEPSQGSARTLDSPQGGKESAKVQRLVDLGFDKKQVLDALSLFHGNEDQVASYLFEG